MGSTMEGPTTVDETNADAEFERISHRLWEHAQRHPKLVHTFRFLAGALGALREARGYRPLEEHNNEDRAGYLKGLEAYLCAFKPDEAWSAGFYYNAAIMRIDACYERLLRAVLNTKRTTDQERAELEDVRGSRVLARMIKDEFNLNQPLKIECLERVRRAVNGLKHGLWGRKDDATDGTVPMARKAIDELLDILNKDELKPALKKAYDGLPPPVQVREPTRTHRSRSSAAPARAMSSTRRRRRRR